MKKIVREDSANYVVSIVEIGEIFDIPNADKIKRTIVYGNNIIIDTNTKTGDKMLYINSGTKLNIDFAKYNNLLTDSELNKDKKPGYVSAKKLLIKAIKLKGIVSDGILLPMEAINFINENISYDLFEINDVFTDLQFGDNTYNLCEKYIVPVRNNVSGNGKVSKQPKEKLRDLIVNNQFRFHNETSHLGKNLFKINEDDELIVTRKCHGSSGILSHVLVIKKLKWYEKLLKYIGYKLPISEYGFIWSSGKPKSQVPKGLVSNTHNWRTKNMSFYNDDIWRTAYTLHKDNVEKGITIYFEITGEGIQGANYTYGKSYDIHIYRITLTNVDGNVYELGWNEVIDYCNKYNLNYCEEYERFKIKDLNTNILDYLTEKYINKSYPDCKIDEGICIRNTRNNEIFKYKSPNFLLFEQKELDNDVSNIEDEQ
jgi:tRNA-binding EMAP/Myf-like protein